MSIPPPILIPYATAANLEEYLGEGVEMPDDPTRLIMRASELIADVTHRLSERIWEYAGEYTTIQIADALANATCAQVEFWMEIGETFDIGNQQGSLISGRLSIPRLPPKLSLRAARYLRSVGFLGAAVPVA